MCLFPSYFILIGLTILVLSKCLFQHFQAEEFLSLFKMTFRNKFNLSFFLLLFEKVQIAMT